MSTIDTLDKTTGALATSMKFLRLLVTSGATIEQLQGPIGSRTKRSNLLAYLAAGCPKVTYSAEGNTAVAHKASASHEEATRILGEDFISSEDVRKVYQLQASDNMDALPSEDDLRWLKANGYILVPMPHEHLSVLDVRNLDNKLFYSKTGGWYEEQKFARDERTGSHTSWLAIKKTVVNGSLNKNWNDQNKLLSDVEYVPNAAEFCWAVTIYYKVRGIYLFPDTYARTSSLASGGSRVYVGFFDARGLYVSLYWDDLRNDDVGVSSARKF